LRKRNLEWRPSFWYVLALVDLLISFHQKRLVPQLLHISSLTHPHFLLEGNCLQLDDGRLGLIDYGQTRRIDNAQRVDFARIVVALNENSHHSVRQHQDSCDPHNVGSCCRRHFNVTTVACAMRHAGFATRNNTDNDTMCQYAGLLFDSDEESIRHGFSIPQVRGINLMIDTTGHQPMSHTTV
jgi:hypothetical protein